MIEVAITNDTTVLQDAEVTNALPAFQTQVSRDFCPIWGVDALLKFYAKNAFIPPSSWRLSLADDSTQQGALGFHLTQSGTPFGFAFVKSDIAAGASWTVTATHELLEMLADPYVMCVVDIPSQSGWGNGGTLLAQEIADAPEADAYAYEIPGADKKPVKVSSFVTPAWFGSPVPPGGYPGAKGRFDWGGVMTQAFQILPGGYIAQRLYRRAQPWGTVQGAMAPVDERPYILKSDGTKMGPNEIPQFSRRHRRMMNMAAAQVGSDPVVAAIAEPVTGLDAHAMIGGVRNDADALIAQASGSLSRLEAQATNVTNWMATMMAGLAGGKTKVRIAPVLEAPYGFSLWLEKAG